ncbi:phage tail protein [Bdellovibrio sp. KM01]|uniref:phage tail protein n=1 Tax=Bdellovibrio sp. KM01 TaxID=2748865 RepID=UPI0015EA32A7|nr:phage tail protein [Bdellovibrio sp. KM01]QLY27058.1 tail fiber protein [Bdellovibrio sp. KM01]
MKKYIVLSLIAISALGFTHKNDLKTMGLRFVAPGVEDKTKILNPEEGEIVYESNASGDKRFYGRTNNTWEPLSSVASLIPAGVILPFGGSTAPGGYYLADGSAYPIAGNEDLHAAIGTSFGDGTKTPTGASTGYTPGQAFNVPDMRGRFMRGVAGSSTLDPDKTSRESMITGGNGNTGNMVGSAQGDLLKTHFHSTQATINYGGSGSWNFTGGPLGQSYVTGSTGGQETRPVNLNVNYIIKR